MQNMGTSILVRTETGMKMFSQADIDKRGIKIWRDGKLAEISDFRANDKLTATIVTTKAPQVMTEREVQATLAKSGGAAAGGAAAAQAQPRRPRCQASTRSGGVGSRGPVLGRGFDCRLCSENAAQDRKPARRCRADRPGLSPRGARPDGRASSLVALRPSLICRRAARHPWGAARAAFTPTACAFEFLHLTLF